MRALKFESAFNSFTVAFVLAVLLESAPGVQGATTLHRWTGGSATSGNWSVGANWLGGVAPVGGDQRLIFQAGAARKMNTNNFPAGTTFESIWIVDDGYNIYGNTVSIDYLRGEYPAGTSSTFRPDIQASGDLQIIVDTNNSTLVVAGDIVLTSDDLLIPSFGLGDVTISGVISGTGNLIKSNTGDLSLSGFGANAFSGTTTVTAGILRLNRFILSGTTAIPGDLVIGTGTSGPIGDIVVLDNDNQIANTADVVVNGSGSLELSGQNDTIGSLTLTAGAVLTGTGTLTLGGNVRVNATAQDSVIAGKLNLGAGTERVFDVVQGAQLNVSAEISGSAGISLVKSNRGTLYLSASNIFGGDVQLVGGTLTIAHGSALGNTTGVTELRSGTLVIDGTIGVLDFLNVQGPAPTLALVSGSASWIGSVALNDDLFISVPTNEFLTIIGQISGPAGWTKYGEGTLQLKTTYTNTYAGTGWVQHGDMILDGVFHQQVLSGSLVIGTTNGTAGSDRVGYIKQQQIGDGVPVTVHNSGVLALQGMNDTIGSLSGAGQVDLGSGTLTIGANNASTLFSGAIMGTGSLVKTGSATLTLTGTNTYSGVTTNLSGTLLVNGILSSPVTQVRANSTLGGTGQVQAVSVFFNGRISPGASPGNLNASTVLLPNGGVLRVELNGPAPGVDYDRLTASGTVTLGGVLDLYLGFTPLQGNSFMILNKTSAGAISGTFTGLPEGQTFAHAGLLFQITYVGGNGNDVVITRVPAPASNISSILPDGVGAMSVSGIGLPNLLYTIEGTTNLSPPITWATIHSALSDVTGLYQFIDTDATLYPMRFYRILSP